MTIPPPPPPNMNPARTIPPSAQAGRMNPNMEKVEEGFNPPSLEFVVAAASSAMITPLTNLTMIYAMFSLEIYIYIYMMPVTGEKRN